MSIILFFNFPSNFDVLYFSFCGICVKQQVTPSSDKPRPPRDAIGSSCGACSTVRAFARVHRGAFQCFTVQFLHGRMSGSRAVGAAHFSDRI